MPENKPNVKTYYDLIADTENAWELEENLEELLFDCDDILEEAIRAGRSKPVIKGDIIMANNGVSERERGMPITAPHRIFIVEDATGEVGSRIFKGYLLSSKVRKANYNNKHFPKTIYIKDYATILARGPEYNKEVFINLSDLYVIDERLIDPTIGGLWKGHAKQEFIDFIDKAVADISQGKSTEATYWLND